jgi:DNA end-binding protein Ku
MPRSLWTGSLSFGLVNVPVQLVSAVRDLDLHFRQLHEEDKSPIETQRWCSEEDKEVPFDAITRSYELDSGKSVIVTDEDLEAVEPRKTRTIDIEQFVDLGDVDPIYFDHPYWLVPAGDDEGATRAYKLLLGVMEKTDHAALGRFVMRAKEHLAIVRARDGALTLTTMRFHDEVRSPKDVPSASGKSTKPSKQQLDAAVDLIEALAENWDPSKHEDRYRKRLQKVVDKKRKGQTIEIEDEGAEEGQGGEVPDLMAALERSLADARKGSGRGKSRSSKGGSKAKSAG